MFWVQPTAEGACRVYAKIGRESAREELDVAFPLGMKIKGMHRRREGGGRRACFVTSDLSYDYTRRERTKNNHTHTPLTTINTNTYNHGNTTNTKIMDTQYSRCGDVVEDQEETVGFGIAPPVLARSHRPVELIVDHALSVEVGHHKLCLGVSLRRRRVQNAHGKKTH